MKRNKPQAPQKPAVKTALPSSSKEKPVWMVAALALTFIAYIPVFNADYVNWDDGDYSYDNIYIRSFSNLNELLTVPVQGNYHPLTMISLAMNYAMSGLEPWSYHVTNLLLHLLNTFLVFLFIYMLSRKNIFISFFTALLFGVHPMHVESVAWISERKDVLYTAFFLAGLISYLKYADEKKGYVLSVVWLAFSLASKPAAVIFPVALFAIDFFRARKFSFSLITEKIPHFALAAAAGYLTILGQSTIGATEGVEIFSSGKRILFGFYGIMMYMYKLFLPVNLSPFYPFPPVHGLLPLPYYLAPVVFIALACLCFFTWKKHREITFGISFFIINLLLVLQVFSVGSAVMADRYTYVPYIGIFFMIGFLVHRLLEKKMQAAFSITLFMGAVLTAATFVQVGVWKNGKSLWEHAVKISPSARAHINLATLQRKEGNADAALKNYNEALRLQPKDHEALCNRGNIYLDRKQFDLAMNDYNSSLMVKPDYHPSFDNRGVLYMQLGKTDSALLDFNRALQIKPDYKATFKNRAVCYQQTNRDSLAVADFYSYLVYDPENDAIYNSIAVSYQKMMQHAKSIEPFTKAIAINPSNGTYYLNRSYSYYAMGDKPTAMKDAMQARKFGARVEESYFQLIR